MKKLKHNYCGRKGCYTIVKKEGDFCKRHQGLEDQIQAGTVEGDHPDEKLDMVSPPKAEEVSDQQGQSHIVEPNKKVDDIAESGKLIESCCDCAPDGDCAIIAKTGHCACGPDAEIPPVSPHPPQEQADPLVLSSSPATDGTKGLAALLCVPAPPPVGLFIPFAVDELAALEESEVTPEVIREFVIMGLEGKLQACDAAA